MMSDRRMLWLLCVNNDGVECCELEKRDSVDGRIRVIPRTKP